MPWLALITGILSTPLADSCHLEFNCCLATTWGGTYTASREWQRGTVPPPSLSWNPVTSSHQLGLEWPSGNLGMECWGNLEVGVWLLALLFLASYWSVCQL